MSISMHSASVPIFLRTFKAMLGWLDKAQAHAEARKFDTANYLGLRLAPDMLPFTRQIQIATDGAKGCVARLAGVEVPKWDDNEATLDELRARIHKAIDYVQAFTAAQIDGSDQALRAAEPVFPRHHDLRAVAPCRGGHRQTRFSGGLRRATRPAGPRQVSAAPRAAWAPGGQRPWQPAWRCRAWLTWAVLVAAVRVVPALAAVDLAGAVRLRLGLGQLWRRRRHHHCHGLASLEARLLGDVVPLCHHDCC
jgi:hypothetical protein